MSRDDAILILAGVFLGAFGSILVGIWLTR